MKIVIILTATLDVNNCVYTLRTNTEERLADYQKSLEYYIKNTTYDIIICENSGSKYFEELKKLQVDNRIEFLQYNGNNFDRNLGKGYGERATLNYILNNSKLIQDNNYSYACKITGRLILENIVEIVEYVNNFNKKYHFLHFGCNEREKMCNTRCYFIKPFSISKLFEHEINDTNYQLMEHCFYNLCKKYPSELIKIEPKFIGICGGTNTSY
jgi:hypothetical protein